MKNFVAFFLSSLFLFSATAFGQASKAREIDAYVKAFADANQFWGVVLAVEDGKVIYEKAFGLANAEFMIPNQTNTRFGIASITKPMTGVILTRLVEEKKIAPEDKLSKYIPDFPNGDKITIEMLRSHRSGILHRVMKPEEESLPYTSAEFVEKVKQAKLAFEPGTQRLYSSGGYAVLARVLEIASGKPYAQLLQEYVFSPAAMRDSMDFNSENVMERRSQDYMLDAKGVVNAALKDYSFLVGAGSVYSTAMDVYRFGDALAGGKYGDAAKTDAAVKDEFVASGSTNGHRAFVKVSRAKKRGYVLVSNLGSGAFDIVQTAVEAIMDGKPVAPAMVPNPKIIPNPNKNPAEFAGRYRRQDGGGEIEIVIKNNVVQSGDIKLYPTGADRFFDYKFFGDVTFVRDGAGRIKEIKWSSPGFESVWVRQ
ncbi:MAG TPA: serine hydrolase domain-containing protein [Pyrinomonadaceae bacterium]|jgi:CubicO group peptidase (beta-lactamase class C family)